MNLRENKDYIFVTNFVPCTRQTIEYALAAVGVPKEDYEISEEAYSITGESAPSRLLPNNSALFLRKKEGVEESLVQFFHLMDYAPIEAAKIYRRFGYPILEKYNHAVYVGMSNEYIEYLSRDHDYPSEEEWESIGCIEETSLCKLRPLLIGMDWTYGLYREYYFIAGLYRIFGRKGADNRELRRICEAYLVTE